MTMLGLASPVVNYATIAVPVPTIPSSRHSEEAACQMVINRDSTQNPLNERYGLISATDTSSVRGTTE